MHKRFPVGICYFAVLLFFFMHCPMSGNAQIMEVFIACVAMASFYICHPHSKRSAVRNASFFRSESLAFANLQVWEYFHASIFLEQMVSNTMTAFAF